MFKLIIKDVLSLSLSRWINLVDQFCKTWRGYSTVFVFLKCLLLSLGLMDLMLACHAHFSWV